MDKLKVVTLCSGYDSQCLALERLKKNYPEFDYELIAWSEFDPESKQPLDKQPADIAPTLTSAMGMGGKYQCLPMQRFKKLKQNYL